MIPAGTTMPGSYDPLIVALSVVIAVASSYAALDVAGRVTANKGWRFAAWLTCGSVAMGIGIWSMHSTAMLGFKLPVPVSYDWRTVLQSFFVAVLASSLALYLVSRKKMSRARALGGGVMMGFGIAPLHYMDMLAMRMMAECHFNSMWWPCPLCLPSRFPTPRCALPFTFETQRQRPGEKSGALFSWALRFARCITPAWLQQRLQLPGSSRI